MTQRLGKVLLVAIIAGGVFAGTGVATSSGAPAQFLNISTRGFVQTGDRVLIGGFIVSGSSSKRVLLRGMGPSLSAAGLPNVLTNPALEVRNQNGSLLFANDNWKDAQRAEIEATGLAPRDDHEAAVVANQLASGSYTAILRGAGNETGIGLIEVYDLSPNSGSLLANISSRGFVAASDRAMIGGFIVGGGSDPTQILVRGIGPSLAGAGIADSLRDPTLELRLSNGGLVAANDNWKESQQLAIERTGAAPSKDLESAIVANLSAGAYTAIVRGKDGGVGTALVELYDLNASLGPATRFSFENGLEGWVPKATDLNDPPIFWAIEPSQDRASEGSQSLKFELSNLNDAGKIWIERAFPVRPNQRHRVNVQFSFATADWGDLNHFTIIAGVRTQPAETRADLTYQDHTGNGEQTDVGYKWLKKSYDFNVVSGANGALFVDVGVWGTWETYRAYYVDSLWITITEQ
jgi:hypothetical protein